MNQPPWPPHQVVAPVSAAELRPRRRWYVVALAVFLVCTIAGVAGCVVLFSRVAQGVNLQELRGGSTEITLRADTEKGIYATGPVSSVAAPNCRYHGPGRLHVARANTSETYTSHGTRWVLVGTIRATKSGTYTGTCQQAGATRIGVGKRLGGVFLTGAGAIGVLVAGFFVGLLAGGVIALVVLVRRFGHRRQLQRTTGPPPVV